MKKLSKPAGLVRWFGLAALGWAVCQAPAAEMKTNGPAIADGKTSVEASEALGLLQRQVDHVAAAYEAYKKATETAQRDRLWKAYIQTNDTLIPKIMEAVRQRPGSSTAFELLKWVVTNGRNSVPTLEPYALEAVEWLRDYHTQNPQIGPICRVLGQRGDPLHQPTIDFLKLVIQTNPERGARGYATLALARITKQKAEAIAFWQIAPAFLSTNAAMQKIKVAYAKQGAPKPVFYQAEQLFETVIAQYADCPNFPSGPALRQAEIELYECRHLELGSLAPEIEGEDLEGNKLKLSEYRGKVVVLDFWASWCGPCMQMIPHARAMAQRLEGKPFALVGVNADAAKAAAQGARAKEHMTWRSFWNGGSSEGGIAEAWNVNGWPTVYVLDSKGTIRFKQQGYGGKRTDALLDELVERLLKEAETNKQ